MFKDRKVAENSNTTKKSFACQNAQAIRAGFWRLLNVCVRTTRCLQNQQSVISKVIGISGSWRHMWKRRITGDGRQHIQGHASCLKSSSSMCAFSCLTPCLLWQLSRSSTSSLQEWQFASFGPSCLHPLAVLIRGYCAYLWTLIKLFLVHNKLV